mgnify:CR=1 FL=1
MVVCSVAWPLNESEAGVDLVLIETSLLVLCNFILISMRMASLTWEKLGGFYRNKVNINLALIQRPGKYTFDCKRVYCIKNCPMPLPLQWLIIILFQYCETLVAKMFAQRIQFLYCNTPYNFVNVHMFFKHNFLRSTTSFLKFSRFLHFCKFNLNKHAVSFFC